MLQLKDVRKSYKMVDFTQTALDGVSITFRDNEFAAVLGPSGSGKTTMLNIIGGLDHYDSGDLIIDDISTKKYRDRNWDTYRNNRIGFVFQSYNLIPHQTILSNVELALTLSGVSKKQRRARAKQALEEVGLGDHIRKKPSQLSGGQMQRVAIARALINDPEILLADEPTGALDTQTSTQVMDLLTQIAKDRLVIMVTHNPELAEEYANRIIHLKDGQIVSDSRPFDLAEEQHTGRKPRKAGMSFFTAVALSFSNLMTKKGRTFVTALAGSIGIIGIAAILALANGINAYVKNIEEETLSIYPLSIQTSGFDLSGMFGDSGSDRQEREEDPNSIREHRIVENVFSRRNKNDLASLKTHFEQHKGTIDPYVKTIQYMYDVTPQIFLADTSNGADQVNPDSIMNSYGMGGGNPMASMMGFSSGMNVFSEMPADLSMFDYQYDVLAGHWPENYDETVLVLSDSGGILDFQLYAMGLRDRSELKEMMVAFMNKTDAEIEIDNESHTYSYEELMAAKFKVIHSADKYHYDDKFKVWVDKSGDEDYMKSLVDDGFILKIVGIVKPAVSTTSLSPGINYTPELIRYLMDEASGKKLVQEQIANPDVNVLTGKTFAEEAEESKSKFDFSKLFSFNADALKDAFSFDMSAFDMSAFDFSNISFDFSNLNLEMPSFDIGDLTDVIGDEINIPDGLLEGVMQQVIVGFFAGLTTEDFTDPAYPNNIMEKWEEHLASEDVQELFDKLAEYIDPSSVQQQVTEALMSYMASAMQSVMMQMMGQISEAIGSAMSQIGSQMQGLGGNLGDSFGDAFSKAFQINTNEDDIADLMMSILNPVESTYERNLSILGYASPDSPSQINIYPRDFESKQEIINFLDSYNQRMEDEGNEEKVVRYTDLVGAMMSSVTSIIDIVSYALIAFVSISLVVSSIMIGVITYISVLERKKEIGILRAIGASKKNIRQVFNAETLIVGFVAGLLGVLITLVICTVANYIIYNKFNIVQIARLPVMAAGILVGVSMFLTFIAGLMPSSSAARKDPVEALRSE